MVFGEQKAKFEALINPVADEPHKCNDEKCKRCSQQGITCCEHLPCYLSPNDIKDLTFEGICELIDTGLVSLDWWCGDPRLTKEEIGDNMEALMYKGYFLRMRGSTKSDIRPVVHPAIGLVECIMLGENGCILDYPYRPKGGRELTPGNDPETFGGCTEGYTKQMCALEWLPYHDTLQQIFSKYYFQDKMARRHTQADFLASFLTTAMLGM